MDIVATASINMMPIMIDYLERTEILARINLWFCACHLIKCDNFIRHNSFLFNNYVLQMFLPTNFCDY